MKLRIISALIMAPLAIALILLLPTPWFIALVAILFALGLWEWFALSGIHDTLSRGVLVAANLAVMTAMVWSSKTAGGTSSALFTLFTVVALIWWCIAPLWLKFRHIGADHDSWTRVLKLFIGSIVILGAWASMALIHGSEPNGHRWLLVALVAVWSADSGAYFAGKFLGKHKMSPNISPNKTIEGLIGGLIAAVLIGLLFAWFAEMKREQLPVVALSLFIAALFSVLGDLVESLLKRQAGAKDSGNVIPGHGGILDRIDGVVAAIPVFAICKDIFRF